MQKKFPTPKFANRLSFASNHTRWVNVIKLADYGARTSKLALTFPPNIKGEEFPRLAFAEGSLGFSVTNRVGSNSPGDKRGQGASLAMSPAPSIAPGAMPWVDG
jgi:hypothetical protein